MKFLISDYASPYTTEPYYFNTTLNLAGCSATLWQNNLSTFDMFDITKPDVYLAHISSLHNETLVYLSENKNIEFVLNITNIKESDFQRLHQAFDHYQIKPKFLFNNNINHKLTSKHNIVTIQHGADIYFPHHDDVSFNIEYGIFINSKSQMTKYGNTYHYIHNGTDENDADFTMPVSSLNALYKNYQNIVIKYFNGYFPQFFFDAAYYGNAIFYDAENQEDVVSNLSKLLGEDSFCDINNLNSGNIKQKIKNKHTCLHRTKTLLSQFSAKEYIDKLSSIIEEKLI